MQKFTGSAAEWDRLILEFPSSHLLQTWEWAETKRSGGWDPTPYVWTAASGTVAACMVLRRTAPLVFEFAPRCMLYAPKGPLLDWSDLVLARRVVGDLQDLARHEEAVFLKIDPDVVVLTTEPGKKPVEPNPVQDGGVAAHLGTGWRYSGDQIQFANTAMIDLAASDEVLLQRMKPKARYNLGLARRKDVIARVGTTDDLPKLYQLYANTSARDGFVIRDEDYYLRVWRAFMQTDMGGSRPGALPLLAEVQGELVAGLMLFFFGRRAYYMYGMSADAHREKMPTYLLQWEAIQEARRRGCTQYDLWGAPDVFEESDSMWGVYRFKLALGAQTVLTSGAWDFTTAPVWYWFYNRLAPLILGIMRFIGLRRTRSGIFPS